jgi:hypothetical protein
VSRTSRALARRRSGTPVSCSERDSADRNRAPVSAAHRCGSAKAHALHAAPRTGKVLWMAIMPNVTAPRTGKAARTTHGKCGARGIVPDVAIVRRGQERPRERSRVTAPVRKGGVSARGCR